MCNFIAYGFLVQGLDDCSNFVKNFVYNGINAFFQYPLTSINNPECRKLTDEQCSKKITDNQYQSLEFISDLDLLKRYVDCCLKHNINIRILFVESCYLYEEWKEPLLETVFLGYEYCPIPIDEQIISDLDWYKPFSRFWYKLNKNGLFNTYDEVLDFKNTYDLAWRNNEIGDGEMDAFICKVSEIPTERIEYILSL